MENVKFIISNITEPYFNIASEEYLLKQTAGYYIYLWRNDKAVIVGNNQNTLLEVNLNKADEKGVKVVRRLTGGGAVYHDVNNICYTIIAPYLEEENSYKKFTKPVIEYLNSLGVKAEFSGRNDICVDNKKISGNAQVVYKDRIMHHGTLLFDTNLNELEGLLIQNKIKVESKGIKSVRARVVNVREYLPNLTTENFLNGLIQNFESKYEKYAFTKEDVEKIQKLVEDKYSTYEWNIGASIKGNNRIDLKFKFGILTITFDLIDGIIKNCEIFGDFFSNQSLLEFGKNLNGKRFLKEDLLGAFNGIENYINGASKEEIVNEIFK